MCSKIFSLLLLSGGILIQACKQSGYIPPENALFTKLTPAECGIDFRNDITDDSVFNVTTYRNFYNGGGVAIGDINNDGLADVFMTANQGKNKLFLNKGNFKFKDITDKAGIIKDQKWSTGVTMADVNGDGLLDIYVSAAGSIAGDTRENALYINRGNLYFEEEADKYNLADSGGYHTQASFFDYDSDGDLDVFLLNNDCSVRTDAFPNAAMRNFRKKTGDKLLRNDNNVFTDVSEAAGIFGSNFGFGLGVSIGDINGDRWPDVYVSNDFFEKDYLYINQRNGTFRESSDSCIAHMSQSSMGADIADMNNDGLMDIFSTDMLPEDDYRLKKNTRFDGFDTYTQRFNAGYHHQLLSNMLHLNNGNNTFSEISEYAGVNATDWSWGALIFDLDNDGWKDIIVCNGMYVDVTDQDYIDFMANESQRNYLQKNNVESDYRLLKSMVVSDPVLNYAFINQHNLTFKNQSFELGLGEPGFSNGAAYADLDNDGDLDLIVNNLNSECFVYRNNTTEKFKKNFLRIRLKGETFNTFGIGASVAIYAGGLLQTLENFPTRGFQSSVEPILTFGLDKVSLVDSLVVVWPGCKVQWLKNIPGNKELLLEQSEASEKCMYPINAGTTLFSDVTTKSITGNIAHKENHFVDFNIERLMPHLISTEGPEIAVADLNGDGLEDFIVGAAKHDTTKVFIQTTSGTFVPLLPQPDLADDAAYEDAGMAIFDVDKDDDLDLIIVSGGNLDEVGSRLLQPRLYINNGKGIFERDSKKMPSISVNASCVSVCDLDNDGYPDIVIGGRSVPGRYGVTPRSYLLQNNNGNFTDVTSSVAPALQNLGMVTDAIWLDIDNDNEKEFIIVGEWMPISIFKYKNGRLQVSSLNAQFSLTNGWWNSIKAVDIDNDGDSDFLAGNLGLNSKIKADSLHPAQLYINDFDKNGTEECILTYYKADGKSYPYHLKNEITAQIPVLKKKFLRHAAYAGKNINEIFNKEQLATSVVKKAYQFQTCLFINNGKGKFEMKPLSAMAQIAPVYGVLADDFDGDNINDIFLAGNFFGLKPEFGRYDASYGTFLKGKGDNKFEYLSPSQSGLFYRGEVRDIEDIMLNGRDKAILLSKNNSSLQLFKKNIDRLTPLSQESSE